MLSIKWIIDNIVWLNHASWQSFHAINDGEEKQELRKKTTRVSSRRQENEETVLSLEKLTNHAANKNMFSDSEHMPSISNDCLMLCTTPRILHRPLPYSEPTIFYEKEYQVWIVCFQIMQAVLEKEKENWLEDLLRLGVFQKVTSNT